jgi:hypothetical protein
MLLLAEPGARIRTPHETLQLTTRGDKRRYSCPVSRSLREAWQHPHEALVQRGRQAEGAGGVRSSSIGDVPLKGVSRSVRAAQGDAGRVAPTDPATPGTGLLPDSLHPQFVVDAVELLDRGLNPRSRGRRVVHGELRLRLREQVPDTIDLGRDLAPQVRVHLARQSNRAADGQQTPKIESA